MRLLACATALALSVPATPAAPTAFVYGYAWPDGQGHLRVVPRSAALKAVAGAKELRLDYTGAAYGRITVACDLKETEGRANVDAKGLGRTMCKPADLAATLGRGPVPVRVEHRGGKATRVNEILVKDWPDPRLAKGTLKRVNDTTVLFATGGKTVKLGYAYTTTFSRTTARCGDGWLAGRPVNASQNGLGKKDCTWKDLTKALKGVRHPVLVKIDYTPGVDSLNQVWEIFGDA
ncbi:hypothetical protein [Nonomuraea insulae]|uniref:Uncharacterized protein n=1 Tax=Nonomuraea insulae TaxID=1616787 RepID=A0ABW1CXP1_9ACTN